MDIKHNINFFKINNSLKAVGAGMLIVGLLLLWLGWSYISWILMLILTPSGLGLFLYVSAVRSNDSEILEDISKAVEDMSITPEDLPYYNKRAHYTQPFIAQGFEYSDGLMFQKARDGSVISTKYTKSVIHSLEDRLYIKARTVSPISDDLNEVIYDILLDDIKSFELIGERTKVPYKKSYLLANNTYFLIKTDNGDIKLPVHEDVNTDEFVEKLQKKIK